MVSVPAIIIKMSLATEGKKAEQPVTIPTSTAHSAFGLDIALSHLLSNRNLTWRN